jgi:hypothetical protein
VSFKLFFAGQAPVKSIAGKMCEDALPENPSDHHCPEEINERIHHPQPSCCMIL